MNFGKWFGVVLVALGCGIAAHAQLAIYGMYSGDELSNIQCLSTAAPCSNGTTSPNKGNTKPSGGFIGGYYELRNFGPVRLGGDIRGGIVRANKSASSFAGGAGIATSNSVLAGVRASIKTPISFIKPYVQGSVGFARSDASEPRSQTNPPTPQIFDNFIQYQFFAGADVKILPVLDLRAIELGIGDMNRVGSGTGSSSIGVKSIGAGLVFHFPAR